MGGPVIGQKKRGKDCSLPREFCRPVHGVLGFSPYGWPLAALPGSHTARKPFDS